MDPQLSISESEWRIMKIVWADAPLTLPEILDRAKDTGWSKTTVQTYLARLVKKGALTTPRYRNATASLPKAAAFCSGSMTVPCPGWYWGSSTAAAFHRKNCGN